MTINKFLLPVAAMAVFMGGITMAGATYASDIGIQMPKDKKDKDDEKDPYKELKDKLREDEKDLKKQGRRNNDDTPMGMNDDDREKKSLSDIVNDIQDDDD